VNETSLLCSGLRKMVGAERFQKLRDTHGQADGLIAHFGITERRNTNED